MAAAAPLTVFQSLEDVYPASTQPKEKYVMDQSCWCDL